MRVPKGIVVVLSQYGGNVTSHPLQYIGTPNSPTPYDPKTSKNKVTITLIGD